MILIFFSRCHVFYPLFHLSGLPFSFFCKQSHFFSFINIFHSFSPFFIPHRHFTPFSCLSLPLPPVFILFANVYTTFSPFQSFFAFSQLIFIFFAFSASSIVLHPLFAIFLDRPSFFRSAYVTLPVSFFTFHVSQNVSRETSFFTFFGLRRSMRSDLLPDFPKITLIFHLSYFLNNRIFYSIFDFPVFSTFFLYFCVFHAVFRLCFLSFIKLFNYIFIFSYELNFYIRFFGFSKPFTKRILRPFFQGFLPIWKDFIP